MHEHFISCSTVLFAQVRLAFAASKATYIQLIQISDGSATHLPKASQGRREMGIDGSVLEGEAGQKKIGSRSNGSGSHHRRL